MSLPANPHHPASIALRRELKLKFKASGLSLRKFGILIGMKSTSAATCVKYYLDGNRSPSFAFAVEIANRIGIDLGAIQKECK